MKKIASLLVVLLCCSLFAVAQHKDPKEQKTRDSLPYQKYPTLPAFNLLELDSSTIFNTYNIPEGKVTVLMFYSPDCDHCQKMAQEIMKHMDSLSTADFYLFTPMTIAASKVFASQYHVSDYKNIRMFKDYEFFFPRFFGASYVPYLAIYDRHKKLVKVYEGGTKISELIRVVNEQN